MLKFVWNMEFVVNTKFVLRLTRAKQLSLDHCKKSKVLWSAPSTTHPLSGMIMITDSMVVSFSWLPSSLSYLILQPKATPKVFSIIARGDVFNLLRIFHKTCFINDICQQPNHFLNIVRNFEKFKLIMNMFVHGRCSSSKCFFWVKIFRGQLV